MKKKLFFLCSIGLLYQGGIQAQPYVIDAFAGGVCSGVPASQAYFYGPTGLATDAQGNFYVGLASHYIMKVSTNGIVTTFAGTGSNATSGDGGPAINASIGDPYSLCADKLGNIYFAEQNQNYIRKIDVNGIISTVAGNGNFGSGGDGGPAINASMSIPSSLAIDNAGNLYIGDAFNNKIRKVDANGIISTIAGTGNSGFSGDGGPATQADITRVAALDVDAAGNIYFGDWFNHRIRKIDKSGIISTIAGNGTEGFGGEGGPASAAILGKVTGLDVDNAGNIYFTCGYSLGLGTTDQNRVCKINTAGTISTIAHSPDWGYTGDGGPAIAAKIAQPAAVLSDVNGNIFFIESTNELIRKVNSSNIISTVAGTNNGGYCGNGVPALNASLGSLSGLSLDAQGNVLFAEDNRIRKIDAAGIVWDFAGNGLNTAANYVASGDGGNALNAMIYNRGITSDQNGNVYCTDGKAIRKINSTKIIDKYAGNYSATGAIGDGGLALYAYFSGAYNIFYDQKNNCLYISDTDNNKIRKIDANGIINTICGTGTAGNTGDAGLAVAAQVDHPGAITADANGNIYFSDQYRSIIRKIDPNGIITRFAGTGNIGANGDGGPATAAEIAVSGLATDKTNNLYITAGENIRKITANGTINTIAGDGSPSSAVVNGVDALKSGVKADGEIVVSNNDVVYFIEGLNRKIRKLTPGVVGVQEKGANQLFNVYPNPSQGYVSFKANNIEANLQLQLFDVLGKQIETRALNGFNNSFDFSGLVNGVYSYSIMNKNQLVYSGKLIIAHEE